MKLEGREPTTYGAAGAWARRAGPALLAAFGHIAACAGARASAMTASGEPQPAGHRPGRVVQQVREHLDPAIARLAGACARSAARAKAQKVYRQARPSMLVTVLSAMVMIGFTAPAHGQTELPENWSLVPSGLTAGDQFRLLIVTSTTRSGQSSNIADYDAHVQSAVGAGHTDIQGYASAFKALASTATVAARDNTATTGTGVPIYWLNGDKVADDYASFYDGQWDSQNAKHEDGSTSSNQLLTVWTGSTDSGGIGAAPLGSTQPGVGRAKAAGSELAYGFAGATGGLGVYGLSPVFEVGLAPSIESIGMVSAPDANDTYRNGHTIELEVHFDKAVEVVESNPPQLTLLFNESPRAALYTGGSGTDTLRFAYTVQDADVDADGLSIGANALARNGTPSDGPAGGGTIRSVATGDHADLTSDPQDNLSEHKVNGTPGTPRVRSVQITSDPNDDGRPGNDDTYAIGDDIVVTVTFTENVTFTGTPRMVLRIGGGELRHLKWASYKGNDQSPRLQLRLTYTVQEGTSDDNGIYLRYDELLVLSGTIIGTGGAEADLSYPTQGTQAGHKVDGIAPTISSAGTTVSGSKVEVIYSEELSPATSNGERFELHDGDSTDTSRPITHVSVTGNTATLAIGGDGFGLNTVRTLATTLGAVTDRVGNPSPAESEPITNNVLVVAGTIALTSDPNADGRTGDDNGYRIGDAIEATVTYSDAVTVTRGATPPQIALNVGGEPRLASYVRGSGSTDLVFSYTVEEGDSDTDGVEIPEGVIKLNGGSITMGSTDAPRAFRAVSANAAHMVDGIRPRFLTMETNEDGTRLIMRCDEPISEVNAFGFSFTGQGLQRLIEINGSTVVFDPGFTVTATSLPEILYTTGAVRDKVGNGNALGRQDVINNVPARTNHFPEFPTETATRTLAENTVEPFELGAPFVATDADADETVTYIIASVGDDRLRFEIDRTTGQLRIKGGFRFDYEQQASYTITVRANDGNDGIDTIVVTIEVLDLEEPPAAPAAPAVTPVSGEPERLSVSWSAPENSGRPAITSYDVRYRTLGGVWQDGPQDTTQTSATLTGLRANESYQVAVRASNADGDSAWSSPGTASTATPSGCATAPAGRIWNGCMTVEAFSILFGYLQGNGIGALVPATFDFEGRTYTVDQLYDNDGLNDHYGIAIGFLPTLTNANPLTLHLGDNVSLAFTDARAAGSGVYEWDIATRQGWTVGGTVAVGISASETRGLITAVDVTSRPDATADTYGRGETIEVSVSFSEAVRISGSPRIGIRIGGDNTNDRKWAHYAGGSETETLRFTYVVQEDDTDTNGIYLQKDDLELNGAIIRTNEDSHAVTLTYSAPGQQSGHKVDGDRVLEVSGIAIVSDAGEDDTYGAAEAIKTRVRFTKAVTVNTSGGSPLIRLEVGGQTRDAHYASGSGTRDIVFRYSVADDEEDTDGVSIPAAAIDLNGATIGSGTREAETSHAAVAPSTEHKVDARRPKVVSAQSNEDGNELTVTFSRALSSARETGYSLAGDPAVITTSLAGNVMTLGLDRSLMHMEQKTLVIAPGTVRDTIGNENATVRQAITNTVPEHIVTITSVQMRTDGNGDNREGDDDTYARGDYVEATATFSEPVTVNITDGTPQLALTIGIEIRHASYVAGSETRTLNFRYTVAEGDEDTDGLSIEAGVIDLNGGTITADLTPATLTHEGLAAHPTQKVDAVLPSATRVETDTYGAELTVTFSKKLRANDATRYSLDGGPTVSSASFTENVVTLVLSGALAHTDEKVLQMDDGTVQDTVGNFSTKESRSIHQQRAGPQQQYSAFPDRNRHALGAREQRPRHQRRRSACSHRRRHGRHRDLHPRGRRRRLVRDRRHDGADPHEVRDRLRPRGEITVRAHRQGR